MGRNVRVTQSFYLLLLIVLTFGGIGGLGALYAPPKGSLVLADGWTISGPEGVEAPLSAPFYFVGEREGGLPRGIYRAVRSFDAAPAGGDLRLVFPYLSGNGVRLSVNGTTLAVQGDMIRGDAVRWNVPLQAAIPQELLGESNRLEVEFYSLYEFGILKSPYLLPAGDFPLRTTLLFMSGAPLTRILIGAFLALAVLLLIPGRALFREGRAALALGASLLGAALFLLDYGAIDYLPFRYVILKKISLGAIHLSLATLLLSFRWLLHPDVPGRSISAVRTGPAVTLAALGGLEFSIALLICLAPTEMVALRMVYRWAGLSVFPSMAVMGWLSSPRRGVRLGALFAGVVVVLTTAAHDVISLFAGTGNVFFTHIGLSVFFLCAAWEVIVRIVESYSKWEHERLRADHFRSESLTDHLTGAHNRKMLSLVKETLPVQYSLVALDLDDFKDLNDRYGHPFGDQVLITLVNLIREHVREDDRIIRMGGDEFLLLLPGCHETMARTLAERLLETIKQSTVTLDGASAGFGCTIGVAGSDGTVSFDQVLKEADQRLYREKESKGRKR